MVRDTDQLAQIQRFKQADAVFELVFSHVAGDIDRAVAFVEDEFGVDRRQARKMLREPQVWREGSFQYTSSTQAEAASSGIVLHRQQINGGPWEMVDDEALAKLLFAQGWRDLSPVMRRVWLDTVRRAYCQSKLPDRAGLVIQMGDEVVDRAGFYLSVGEGVNGPGGYFGACEHSFSDCLIGDFGVIAPLAICWRLSDDARARIQGFDAMLALLRRTHVQLELLQPLATPEPKAPTQPGYVHRLGPYLADTRHVPMQVDGAYRRLFAASLKRPEKCLPADADACCHLVRARDDAEREAVGSALREFFTLVAGQ